MIAAMTINNIVDADKLMPSGSWFTFAVTIHDYDAY
jgi:hypothetical protein